MIFRKVGMIRTCPKDRMFYHVRERVISDHFDPVDCAGCSNFAKEEGPKKQP
jgi:hypothetical protein